MTKCIVLGETKCEDPKKRIIKFVHNINIYPGNVRLNTAANPNQFAVIELISKTTQKDSFDLMYAYNNDRNGGYLYLGHWNDGVV